MPHQVNMWKVFKLCLHNHGFGLFRSNCGWMWYTHWEFLLQDYMFHAIPIIWFSIAYRQFMCSRKLLHALSPLGCWAEQDHTESLRHTSPIPGHQGTVPVRLLNTKSTWAECILMPSLHQFPPRALWLYHSSGAQGSWSLRSRLIR